MGGPEKATISCERMPKGILEEVENAQCYLLGSPSEIPTDIHTRDASCLTGKRNLLQVMWGNVEKWVMWFSLRYCLKDREEDGNTSSLTRKPR